MLSWNKDADPCARGTQLTKSGSVARPGNLHDAHTGSFSRKSMDMPTPPGRCKSTEAHGSPSGSFSTANSLLHAHSNVAKGSLGSEGWWHHMDHGKMNETPLHAPPPTSHSPTHDDSDIKGPVAITPVFAIPGHSLWTDAASETPGADAADVSSPQPADPMPTSPATPTAPASPASPVAPASPADSDVPAVPASPDSPAAPADAPSSPEPATPASSEGPGTPASPADMSYPATPASPPAASSCDEGGEGRGAASALKTAPASGWWCQMETGALNNPLDAAAPAKPDRAGTVTPEFGLTGGNHYLVAEAAVTPRPQSAAAAPPATDSMPASPATASPGASPAAPATAASSREPAIPTTPAAATSLPASPATSAASPVPSPPAPPAASSCDEGGEGRGAASALKTAPSSGWWRQLETGALNNPLDAAAPAKADRAGTVTPEFGLTGGNHYMSISDAAAQSQQVGPPKSDAGKATTPVAAGPAPAATAVSAFAVVAGSSGMGDDEEWSSFTAAPKIA